MTSSFTTSTILSESDKDKGIIIGIIGIIGNMGIVGIIGNIGNIGIGDIAICKNLYR